MQPGQDVAAGALCVTGLVILVLAGAEVVGGWFALPGAALLLLLAFIRLENRRRRKHCEYLRRAGETMTGSPGEAAAGFCTAVNCLDGRVQEPVTAYCTKRFGVRYVDTVTEAGPNLILASGGAPEAARSILDRVALSVEKHRSAGIAVAGHHDCAGNPSPAEEQIASLKKAAAFLHERFGGVEVIALWVNEDWAVQEVEALPPGD